MTDTPSLHPSIALSGYWKAHILVAPSTLPGRTLNTATARSRAPVGLLDTCGVCGPGGAPQLVNATDDSGTGWRQFYFEYHCATCDAYTLYHYDD